MASRRTPTPTLAQMVALKLPGLKSTEWKAIATAIGKVQGNGLQIDDIFPNGILVHDGYTISGNLQPEDILKIGDIISAAGKVKGVEIFPRGITAPEIFRMKLTLHR